MLSLSTPLDRIPALKTFGNCVYSTCSSGGEAVCVMHRYTHDRNTSTTTHVRARITHQHLFSTTVPRDTVIKSCTSTSQHTLLYVRRRSHWLLRQRNVYLKKHLSYKILIKYLRQVLTLKTLEKERQCEERGMEGNG